MNSTYVFLHKIKLNLRNQFSANLEHATAKENNGIFKRENLTIFRKFRHSKADMLNDKQISERHMILVAKMISLLKEMMKIKSFLYDCIMTATYIY